MNEDWQLSSDAINISCPAHIHKSLNRKQKYGKRNRFLEIRRTGIFSFFFFKSYFNLKRKEKKRQ